MDRHKEYKEIKRIFENSYNALIDVYEQLAKI